MIERWKGHYSQIYLVVLHAIITKIASYKTPQSVQTTYM